LRSEKLDLFVNVILGESVGKRDRLAGVDAVVGGDLW